MKTHPLSLDRLDELGSVKPNPKQGAFLLTQVLGKTNYLLLGTAQAIMLKSGMTYKTKAKLG